MHGDDSNMSPLTLLPVYSNTCWGGNYSNIKAHKIMCPVYPGFVLLQIRIPIESRSSAFVAFDGRNRQELFQGDRWKVLCVCIGILKLVHYVFIFIIMFTIDHFDDLLSVLFQLAYKCVLTIDVWFQFVTFTYSVVVNTSPWPIPSINNTGHVTDWFDSLAECLQWNVRKQQKAFK